MKLETLFLNANVQFVKADQSVLPPVWQRLEREGFYPDLVLRAQRFMDFAHGQDCEREAAHALTIIGKGFRGDLELTQPDQATESERLFELKTNFNTAITQLKADFGDRVSNVVWESLGALGTRPDPDKEATIFSQQEHLPYPWWLIDAVLHASGKVYRLFLHMQTRINQHTGMVLDHNCDCNHVVQTLPNTSLIRCELPEERIEEATAALFTHLLTEVWVIGIQGLPTVYGLSPEGIELKQALDAAAAA